MQNHKNLSWKNNSGWAHSGLAWGMDLIWCAFLRVTADMYSMSKDMLIVVICIPCFAGKKTQEVWCLPQNACWALQRCSYAVCKRFRFHKSWNLLALHESQERLKRRLIQYNVRQCAGQPCSAEGDTWSKLWVSLCEWTPVWMYGVTLWVDTSLNVWPGHVLHMWTYYSFMYGFPSWLLILRWIYRMIFLKNFQ